MNEDEGITHCATRWLCLYLVLISSVSPCFQLLSTIFKQTPASFLFCKNQIMDVVSAGERDGEIRKEWDEEQGYSVIEV